MKFARKAGMAVVAGAGVLAMSGASYAADLGDLRGSVKDGGYVTPMPQVVSGGSGPCYFRADAGYSFARDVDIDWAQTDPFTLNYLTSNVSTLNSDGGWFGEVGGGCGTGYRGIRTELMFGFRGDRKVDGEPETFWFDPGGGAPPEDDPLHTSIKSYSLMLNVYKDFGTFGRITPYVGAGIGFAYNQMDEVYFTGNPALVNRIAGNSDLSFAWSLMAGVGYKLTNRATLDVGYRYIDLGEIESGRVDSAGFVNPAVYVDDLASHEIKVGLRYNFGSSDCCAESYVPIK